MSTESRSPPSAPLPPLPVPVAERKTLPLLLRYERSWIISTRAKQIASGQYTPLVELNGEIDPIKIATRELDERKKIPITIVRYPINGPPETWTLDELKYIKY